MNRKKAVIIGSGFAGLAAACFLAKEGLEVTVIEKNNTPGGRARQLKEQGFTFDMGPSWYWMPKIFEDFFTSFNKNIEDYYQLIRLNPSYRIFWGNEVTDIDADYIKLKKLFEKIEKGSANKLDLFLFEAAKKYDIGINKLVKKPSLSITEFLDKDVLMGVLKLDVFINMKKHINKYFKHPMLQQLLEFPVLFLGALPKNIPALYSLMNYADIKLGTWYPIGGMYKIVEAMCKIANELGVHFYFNNDVTKINIENNIAISVTTNTIINNKKVTTNFNADIVVGAADYHFIETKLLLKKYRNYNEAYWNKIKMAPSCLIYFVGLNKKLKNITHHSLFFDSNFIEHGNQIFTNPSWPTNPLFYVCATSVTDEFVAPKNCENLFFLIPIASGLNGDTDNLREKYFTKIISRFEHRIGEEIKDNIIYKKSYSISNFKSDYNAFKGNAYGLANTLKQTAIFKPSCKNKIVENLFYAGQLTIPGPGVPPCIISGEVIAKEIIKYLKK